MIRWFVVPLAVALAAVWSPDTEARTAKSKTVADQLASFAPAGRTGIEKADRVVVIKAERRLVLMRGDRVLDVFRVALGRYAKGHKQREGDQRTPEGIYSLDEKLPKSNFYRAILISYPNEQDALRAWRSGQRPGGRIEIHGLPNGWDAKTLNHPSFDWTDGCIAVTNREMDRIWARVDPGTPIEIFP
jgi:murein L,D-transpeptidase YafK